MARSTRSIENAINNELGKGGIKKPGGGLTKPNTRKINALKRELRASKRSRAGNTASFQKASKAARKGRKLSKTKGAIARRKMRANQTPKQRAARLAKRREALGRWRKWYKQMRQHEAKALARAMRKSGGGKKKSGWAAWKAKGGGRGKRKVGRKR